MHLGATPFSIYNTSVAGADRVPVRERRQPGRDQRGRSSSDDAAVSQGARGRARRDDRRRGRGRHDARAARGGRRPDFDFEAAWRAVEPDDVLTLIYTSGTTGPPKGVELTHANMWRSAAGARPVLAVSAGGRADLLPAVRPHRRPLGHPLHRGDRARRHDHLGRRPARRSWPRLPEVRPDRAGARSRGSGRSSRPRSRAQGVDRSRPALPGRGARPRSGTRLGLDARSTGVISGAAPIAAGGAGVLRRARAADLRAVGDVRDCRAASRVNPPERHPGRHRRHGAARRRAEARRRRRAARARPDRDEGLPQRAGEDRRGASTPTAGCTPATSPRSTTTATCKIVDRKKELIINAAGKNMSPANIEQRVKASQPADRPGRRDRRPRGPTTSRCSCSTPTPARRTPRARPRRRLAGGARRRRRRAQAVDARRRRGQRPASPRGADQALHDRCRPTGCPAATS